LVIGLRLDRDTHIDCDSRLLVRRQCFAARVEYGFQLHSPEKKFVAEAAVSSIVCVRSTPTLSGRLLDGRISGLTLDLDYKSVAAFKFDDEIR
jgi:hypothetical protein